MCHFPWLCISPTTEFTESNHATSPWTQFPHHIHSSTILPPFFHHSSTILPPFSTIKPFSWIIPIRYCPWCWNIYQHLPWKSPSFVGKYTSTMVRVWVCFWTCRIKQFFRSLNHWEHRTEFRLVWSTTSPGWSAMPGISANGLMPYTFSWSWGPRPRPTEWGVMWFRLGAAWKSQHGGVIAGMGKSCKIIELNGSL